MSQQRATYTTKRETERRIIQRAALKRLVILAVLRAEKRRKAERERTAK